MNTLLRVLTLSDRPDDVRPLLDELRKVAYEPDWRQAATEVDYLAALEWHPEIILATYNLAQLDLLHALQLLQTHNLAVAFIVIANSLSEEVMAQYRQYGAADCLPKDHLARLGRTVAQAIEQTKNRQQRQQTELALQYSEMLNRIILDLAGKHLAVLDREGMIVLVNQAWENVSKEMAAPSLIQTGVGVNYLDVCRQVKGDEQPTALAVGAGIEAMLQEKQTYFDSLEYKSQAAGRERWFLLQLTPLPKPFGGGIVAYMEITERKQLEQQLRQQERLAAVGQLATGIVHDFNNTLSVITLYSHLLLQAPDRVADEIECLQLIYQQANRAALLIAQIMDFSRQSLVERHPLQLKPFLISLVNLLRRTLPENIRIKLTIEKRDLLVNADLIRLEQLFMNLAINARDAMPQGGDLQIDVAMLTLEPNTSPPVEAMPAGSWIVIGVSDTGVRISPANLLHVFEPFFTTKAHGVGLGLAQVYDIIRQHEGFMAVKSGVGQGTSFTFYLPVLVSPLVKIPKLESDLHHAGHGELILVVEDDRAIRDVTANILRLLNYEVLKAKNGKEAMTLFGKHADHIALVLCDWIMPMMDGVTLYERLAKKWPAVKMVIMTGYAVDLQNPALTHVGIVDWLLKPFDIEQMARVLQRALRPDEGGA